MKYRRLGKTGLKVSVIGIGTWQFGGEWGKAFTQGEVDRILGKARELGVNLIDTAECYGDHLAESLIGKAVARERDRWIIATKFGHQFHRNFERTDRWSPKEVIEQLEASLRALRTDYVDIYQFHSGSNEVFDNDELWQALNDQVRAGRIRFLGISIPFSRDPYQVRRAHMVGASVIQLAYNRLDRGPEVEVFQACLEQDLGVLVREPLANGLLSGKYKPGKPFENPDDFRSRWDAEETRRKLETVARIQKTEVPPGIPMATWALAWALKHPSVTAVIPGVKSVEHMEANAQVADLPLVQDDHPLALH